MIGKILRGAAVVAPALIVDRITKVWAMGGIDIRAFIPGFVGFRYAENTGVAFSFLSGMPWLVNVLTVALVAAITALLVVDKSLSRWARFGLWLIVAGGLGNLYDRFAYGYVVDFIELLFMKFAIFNVADICVCCGAAIAAAALVFVDIKNEKTTEGA